MAKLRNPLLGTCLALPLIGLGGMALAANPGCATQSPDGIAVVLPSPGPMRVTDAQAERLIADANAMFQRMDAEMSAMDAQMNALAAIPFQIPTPQQVIQASLRGAPWTSVASGNGVMFTSISTDSGTCSETITYSYPAHGGHPIVNVSQRGNACGAGHVNGPAQVQAAQPVAPHAVQPTVPASSHPHLWQVMYRRLVSPQG